MGGREGRWRREESEGTIDAVCNHDHTYFKDYLKYSSEKTSLLPQPTAA